MTHKLFGLILTAVVCFCLRNIVVSYDFIWLGYCILLAGFMSGGER